tara:strand:- start:369 stop:593 length:225 start_codon:yes stop_codon:yes gene_type:complete
MKQTIKIKFKNKDGNLVENNGHVAHGFIDKGTLVIFKCPTTGKYLPREQRFREYLKYMLQRDKQEEFTIDGERI